jgi:choline-glycine betaine transporter
MKHPGMAVCIVVGAVALAVFLASGASASALPAVALAAACPLAMVLMMRNMGHGGHASAPHDERAGATTETDTGG